MDQCIRVQVARERQGEGQGAKHTSDGTVLKTETCVEGLTVAPGFFWGTESSGAGPSVGWG